MGCHNGENYIIAICFSLQPSEDSHVYDLSHTSHTSHTILPCLAIDSSLGEKHSTNITNTHIAPSQLSVQLAPNTSHSGFPSGWKPVLGMWKGMETCSEMHRSC